MPTSDTWRLGLEASTGVQDSVGVTKRYNGFARLRECMKWDPWFGISKLGLSVASKQKNGIVPRKCRTWQSFSSRCPKGVAG
jgi:hypothetical protein